MSRDPAAQRPQPARNTHHNMEETLLQPHPLADLFPPLTPNEYAALLDSIRANGQREAITRHRDGRILDGRHRADACAELGIEVASRTFDGPDADILQFVLDLNLKRRHLSESQRAIVATKVATLQRGRPKNGTQEPFTQEKAAELLGVSRESVKRARKVLDHAEPEIVAAVERGVMPIKTAAFIARKPREQQLGRLERDQRKADGVHRQVDDFYRTREDTIRSLLSAETFRKTVWECACGDGAISRVLIACGHRVISTDLHNRGYGESGVDFLATTELLADDVITNTPYDDDLPERFAIHALELGARKVALICRVNWLEGVQRYWRLFSHKKLARIWVFSPRQTLWRGDDARAEDDGGMTAYAWFVFERDHRGDTTLGWLVQDSKGQWVVNPEPSAGGIAA